MNRKENLLYFPSESFGGLVCCNRVRFEKTFLSFGKREREKKERKEREKRGEGHATSSP
jgi:hypothetical protein